MRVELSQHSLQSICQNTLPLLLLPCLAPLWTLCAWMHLSFDVFSHSFQNLHRGMRWHFNREPSNHWIDRGTPRLLCCSSIVFNMLWRHHDTFICSTKGVQITTKAGEHTSYWSTDLLTFNWLLLTFYWCLLTLYWLLLTWFESGGNPLRFLDAFKLSLDTIQCNG